MKRKKLEDTLKGYQSPQMPDSVIEKTVELAKLEFERTPIQYKMPFRELFVGQIKYISPYLWIVQTILLFIVLFVLSLSANGVNEQYAIITILSVTAPIIALVAIPELAKSFSYNMWEIESTSKFNLQKLIAIRLLIIGIVDITIITILIITTKVFYDISLVSSLLYFLVPFNLANSVYLFLLRKSHEKVGVIRCLIAGLIIVVALASLSIFNAWYVLASTFIWVILLPFSICTLMQEVAKLLKATQSGGEMLWNYQ